MGTAVFLCQGLLFQNNLDWAQLIWLIVSKKKSLSHHFMLLNHHDLRLKTQKVQPIEKKTPIYILSIAFKPFFLLLNPSRKKTVQTKTQRNKCYRFLGFIYQAQYLLSRSIPFDCFLFLFCWKFHHNKLWAEKQFWRSKQSIEFPPCWSNAPESMQHSNLLRLWVGNLYQIYKDQIQQLLSFNTFRSILIPVNCFDLGA